MARHSPLCLRFPGALEGAKVTVLAKGMSLLLPAGWIHAVFTPEDSCVLGWNWLPASQLPPALNIIRTHWGSHTSEIRQVNAFCTREFVKQLWNYAKELLATLQPSAALLLPATGANHTRLGTAISADNLPPETERQLESLVCYLQRRIHFAAKRDVKNPPALLAALESCLKDLKKSVC